MLVKLIDKVVSIRKPILKNTLVFLVEAYFKLILGNSREVDYCQVNFCNIYIKLYEICAKI